ncbi:TPA: STAS-like domain-containing protein [Stenotrophomonas maltophilia]
MVTNQNKTIDIAKDFSPVPAGRHVSDGDYSGEFFRTSILRPALDEFSSVEVILDNTEGFGSSFLEEAFGGLVRDGLSAQYLKDHLVLIGNSPAGRRYKSRIWQYISDAIKLSH